MNHDKTTCGCNRCKQLRAWIDKVNELLSEARDDLERFEAEQRTLAQIKQEIAAQTPAGLLRRSDKMAVHQFLVELGEKWHRDGLTYYAQHEGEDGRRCLIYGPGRWNGKI